MDVDVRIETESDHHRVELITRAAFSYPGRIERGGIGCPFEHWMVHALREKDGIKELSLVAEVDGHIVGHIIYSNAHVLTPDDQRVPVLTFGPLSVQPEYQRKGVGKILMRTSISKARALGYGAILFFGRPEYYPQFGFVEAATFGITDCNGSNYPAFMAMELKTGYLNNIHGRFYESSIYNDSLNREAVKAYDALFRGQ